MSMFTGAGFNYAFLPGKCVTVPLEVPDCVCFVEGGIAEMVAIAKYPDIFCSMHLSVHFSRTPITENRHHQNNFIGHVKRSLSAMHPDVMARIESIGLHLSGSRFTGMGLLGGADTYVASEHARGRAIDFVIKLREATGIPVWLENANYYSVDASAAIETCADMRQICAETNCKVILDLAHIVIEAHNCNIDPCLLLGQAPLQEVAEIHLSGITQSKDGTLHDGHGCPVAEEVWGILDAHLLLLQKYNPGVLITIEHTAPTWRRDAKTYYGDFRRLNNLLSCTRAEQCKKSPDQYMRGYLRYILRTDIPNLPKACDERGISFDVLLDDWLQLAQRSKKRIVVTLDDIPDCEIADSWEVRKNFLAYATGRLRAMADA